MDDIPIIDIAALVDHSDPERVADQIGDACRSRGFFYITGHGVDPALLDRLETVSKVFFAQDVDTKMQIRMERGGHAWRGYFPVGSELTSGQPDQKEGIYFGSELPADHPMVRSGTPLHGANLFPDLPNFADTILEYMEALTEVGHQLMKGIALSLKLRADFFRSDLTADPILLFRIFHYPPLVSESTELWSVGEHTDYGLLTILKQDDVGGLQVKSQGDWIDAPPIPGSFVCNLGDILDRMTGGLYRSTPHRVRNRSQLGRLSFPFFFDPGWHAPIRPILSSTTATTMPVARWDGADLERLSGTYGEYLMSKVSKVFPDLSSKNLT